MRSRAWGWLLLLPVTLSLLVIAFAPFRSFHQHLALAGTPDRFLSLNFDGTFRYSYEPFDTTRNKEKVVTGSYDVSSSRLVFEIGGKKHGVKFSREPGKKAGHTLTFEGELPEDLKAEWRSLP